MAVGVEVNVPILGAGLSTGVQRLFGGAWRRIKSMFRGTKPPPAPQVAKQGDQWLLHRPGRTTATVLASVRQTYERRSAPAVPAQPSTAAPVQQAPAVPHTAPVGHAQAHGPAPAATPQQGLDALGHELDDVEAALDQVQKLARQARTAGTPPKQAKQLALDHRFQRAAAEKTIDAALKSLAALRNSGAQLGRADAARLGALERRTYKALVALQLPKLGAVLDDLERADGKPIDPADYPDLAAADPASVHRSFDPDGTGQSLLKTPDRFLDGMMRSLRTLHQAGALDSDLMHRLSDFGYMREWGNSVFVDDNWKAADLLETQLRLLATGNEGAIDWLLGSDRGQDDRALNMKLKLREVRAEQTKRSGGPEREQEVQPEDLIRARHQLARAKRDLGRYLTAAEGSRWKGDRRTNQIIGRGSDVRITKGVIQAMRARFGDKAGRDVNLLIANVMLLQKKIDALEKQPAVADLQQKLASAQAAVAESTTNTTSSGSILTDPQQLRAAALVGEALVLQGGRREIEARPPIGADEIDAMDDQQLRELDWQQQADARVQQRLEEVLRQIADLNAQGVVSDQTRDLVRDGGDRPLGLADLRKGVDATLNVGRIRTELAAAQADLGLGLDDQELAQMGLGDDDIRAIHATIGGLASQGLRSSADVERTTKAIRDGMTLLERGMTQSTLGQFAGAIPESRANMLLDLVFQDVTGDHHNIGLSATSTEVRDAYQGAMGAFLHAPSGSEAAEATALRGSTARYNAAEQEIAIDTQRLMDADDANQAALAVLKQAAQAGRKIDPHNDDCHAASTVLLAALQADARSQDMSLKGPARQLWAAERDRMLARLAGFDARRMGVTRDGRKADPKPVSLPRLRNELSGLEEIAKAVVTVHDHERRAGLIRTRIETQAKQLDDLLGERRAVMRGDPTDPAYDPAADVHKLVQNGVRAAALHVRQQQGIPLDKFNPNEHRDAIQAVLTDWGIDTDLFGPEISDTLHGAFGPEAIDGWIEDAKRTLTDRSFQKRLQDQPNALVRTLGRLPTDYAGFDDSSRATVVSMIKALRPGDAIEVGQDHSLHLSTGHVPVDSVGFASLKAQAAAAVAKKSQLAIECNDHEIEVFLKTGWGGEGSLEASADVTVAEASLAGTVGGHKLQGVALRFPNTEQGRKDLAELMQNVMRTRPEISAKTFSKAEEVLMVTDRMIKGEVEAEALSTTQMWADKFPGAGLGRTVLTGTIGGYELNASIGATAKLGAGIEGRFVWSESAKSNVYEKEVEKEVAVNAQIGIFSESSTGYDFGMSLIPGAHGHAPFADQPPGALLGVGVDRVLYKTTKISRINQDIDGHYQAHGNELVRRRVVQRIPRKDGKVDSAHLVNSLALDMGDDPRKRGLKADPLTTALQDPANGAFRDAVVALMQQIEKGDTLSVTYTLDPEARRIANELRQEAIDLRAGRPGPHLDQVGDRAQAAERAAALDKEAQALIEAESSYVPLEVQIIKELSTQVNLDLVDMTVLKIGRVGYGGLQRAAVTATNPRNPEAQVHGGHGHGAGGPTPALAPDVYFAPTLQARFRSLVGGRPAAGRDPGGSGAGAKGPRRARAGARPGATAQEHDRGGAGRGAPQRDQNPAPQAGGAGQASTGASRPQPQPTPTSAAPQATQTAQSPPVEKVETPAAEPLAPALASFAAVNWEAALVLASPYRPLEAQLGRLRNELAKLDGDDREHRPRQQAPGGAGSSRPGREAARGGRRRRQAAGGAAAHQGRAGLRAGEEQAVRAARDDARAGEGERSPEDRRPRRAGAEVLRRGSAISGLRHPRPERVHRRPGRERRGAVGVQPDSGPCRPGGAATRGAAAGRAPRQRGRRALQVPALHEGSRRLAARRAVPSDRSGQHRPGGREGHPEDPGRPLHRQHPEPGPLRRLPQGHGRGLVADRQRPDRASDEDDARGLHRRAHEEPAERVHRGDDARVRAARRAGRGMAGRCEGRAEPDRAWCRRGELNTRPLPYQGSALPLSYGGSLGHSRNSG